MEISSVNVASWVLEFLLGGPPHLRSDVGAWHVSLNDNKPSWSGRKGSFSAKICSGRNSPDVRVARSPASGRPAVCEVKH